MPQSLEHVTYFAETDMRSKRTRFGIKAADRTKHMYVIGKSGMGKSTLLENMAIQDIQNGEGLAFFDPHGAAATKLLDYIPENRVQDVIYFAPFDMEHPVGFNVMEDVGYDKRHLVVAGLMSAFRKIWVDAWSSRMEYILENTLLALLEYPDATMLDINRMLVDKSFRKRVVDNLTDPLVKSFWEDEFAKYTDRYTQEATPAIQNKVGQFTSNPLIRNIIGQPHSTFDLRDILDSKKIFIADLSKGRIGEKNAQLLGSMLVTKFYLAALSRADVSNADLEQLPNFYFYVDEFQSFANESFADILSEARKYKLNLIVAHQYIEQMPEEVRAAVFGNVGTMVSFRVGAYDAEVLEKEFSPQFTAEDLVNLGFAQIYLKLMIDGVSSQPFSATTLPPIEPGTVSYREDVTTFSRRAYGQSRETVEELVRNRNNPYQADTRTTDAQRDEQTQRNAEQKPTRQPDRQKTENNAPPRREQPVNHKQKPAEKPGKESDASVSLSALAKRPQDGKQNEKKKRDDSGKSELRDALSSILQDTNQTKQKTQEKPQANRNTQKHNTHSPNKAQHTKHSDPKQNTAGKTENANADTGNRKNEHEHKRREQHAHREHTTDAQQKNRDQQQTKPSYNEVPEDELRSVIAVTEEKKEPPNSNQST